MTEKEELEAMLKDDPLGIALIKYEESGEIKYRRVNAITEPKKQDGSIVSAENLLKKHLKFVAPKAKFIEYAVSD
ncbi:MAG: hypothetical protein ABFD06_15180 [Smithella sp.]